MRIARFAFALAAALLAATPALADWEYTRWQMTPDEVVAASRGAVQPHQGDHGEQVFDLDLRAMGRYRMSGIGLEARFFFTQSEGRLAAVKLIPDNRSCDALRRRLIETHGRGEQQDLQIGLRITWRDEARGNGLLFADIRGMGRMPRLCHVIYLPLEAAN